MILRLGNLLLLAFLVAMAYRLFPAAREVLTILWHSVQSVWHYLRTAR